MAGVKDSVKRAKVRKLLRTKAGREMSDREAADECRCSRSLVKAVRWQLISAGLHPPVETRRYRGENPMYKPGSAARGGYVYDDEGRVVRDIHYDAARKRKGRSA